MFALTQTEDACGAVGFRGSRRLRGPRAQAGSPDSCRKKDAVAVCDQWTVDGEDRSEEGGLIRRDNRDSVEPCPAASCPVPFSVHVRTGALAHRQPVVGLRPMSVILTRGPRHAAAAVPVLLSDLFPGGV
jgi:hypothetical protein